MRNAVGSGKRQNDSVLVIGDQNSTSEIMTRWSILARVLGWYGQLAVHLRSYPLPLRVGWAGTALVDDPRDSPLA